MKNNKPSILVKAPGACATMAINQGEKGVALVAFFGAEFFLQGKREDYCEAPGRPFIERVQADARRFDIIPLVLQ